MPIETANYISDLVPTNPQVGDNIADGPNHFWLIKKSLQNTFPNIKGAVEATQDQLNTITGLVGSSTSDGLDINGNLTVSEGMDLKGNLVVEGTTTLKGTPLVPSVTDWTQKQAVPASDADARYVQPSMLPFTDKNLRFQIIRYGGGDMENVPIPQAFSGPPAFVSAIGIVDIDTGENTGQGAYTQQVIITYDPYYSDGSRLYFNVSNIKAEYVSPDLFIMVGGYF